MYAFLGMPCMRLRMRCMTCRWTPATIPRDHVSASGEYSLFLTHRCLRYYTETQFLFLGSGILTVWQVTLLRYRPPMPFLNKKKLGHLLFYKIGDLPVLYWECSHLPGLRNYKYASFIPLSSLVFLAFFPNTIVISLTGRECMWIWRNFCLASLF